MSIFTKIFKPNPEDNITIENLLLKDELKKLVDKTAEELPQTEGLMIIRIVGGHVYLDSSGFTEEDAIWALNKAAFEILNKGIKLND